jgi:hypothetical protein
LGLGFKTVKFSVYIKALRCGFGAQVFIWGGKATINLANPFKNLLNVAKTPENFTRGA